MSYPCARVNGLLRFFLLDTAMRETGFHHRRLKSPEGRNRALPRKGTPVAACPAEGQAWCLLIRAAPPSETYHALSRRDSNLVGREANLDHYRDSILTYRTWRVVTATLRCPVYHGFRLSLKPLF